MEIGRVTVAATLIAAAGLSIFAGSDAQARLTRDAEPVKLFAFDIDPDCQSPDCLPEEGAFYPGRAQKEGAQFNGEPLQVPRGSDVEFTNVSSEHHNLTAVKRRFGKPIFGSTDHVPQGTSSMLTTQYLRPGMYAFFCDHHPTTMFGLLEIVPSSP